MYACTFVCKYSIYIQCVYDIHCTQAKPVRVLLSLPLHLSVCLWSLFCFCFGTAPALRYRLMFTTVLHPRCPNARTPERPSPPNPNPPECMHVAAFLRLCLCLRACVPAYVCTCLPACIGPVRPGVSSSGVSLLGQGHARAVGRVGRAVPEAVEAKVDGQPAEEEAIVALSPRGVQGTAVSYDHPKYQGTDRITAAVWRLCCVCRFVVCRVVSQVNHFNSKNRHKTPPFHDFFGSVSLRHLEVDVQGTASVAKYRHKHRRFTKYLFVLRFAISMWVSKVRYRSKKQT